MQARRQRAKTVLYLHGSSSGYGADRQLRLLATGLDPTRYRPLVILPERGQLGAELEDAGVEFAIAPLAVLRRQLLHGAGALSTAALLGRNIREVGDLALRRRVALVHSNYSLILAGQGVARRSSSAHLQHVREIYVTGEASGTRLWPVLRRRILRADAVACVSDAAAAQFRGARQVFVLHDGLTRELPALDRQSARRLLGIEPDAFVVAVIGRISDWKGQSVFLRALADPVLAGRTVLGLVAGDASPDQRHFELELVNLVESLQLSERVRLLGFRDDVDVLLAAADAVAVPSTYPDSLPNAAIEAAAAGLPVVATDIGGQREIIRDGITGRIVPPSDPNALALALRELADDPELARRLGRAAAVDARLRFDASRLLDEVQERYDRLLASREVGPRAWLLPVRRLPLAQPVATDLRVARLSAWSEGLGYRPRVLEGGLLAGPWLLLRALVQRPTLVIAGAAVHAPAVTAIAGLLRRRTLVVADVIGLHSLEIDQALAASWLRPVLRRVWTLLERRLARAAGLVIAVNDRHAELVRQRYRADSVFTLRDTAEGDIGHVAPRDRSALGLSEDAVVVGFLGSLVYSRLDDLFEAWGLLSASGGPPLRLLLVGDGPDLERYRARAVEAGLSPTIDFLGGLQHAQAMAVLRACDIGYSDCWSEAGFPAKLFEYMALGLPIVTKETPQVAEVLADEDTALLYRSPGELAERLRRLAAEPALRGRLGEAARRAYLERHTAERRRGEFEALVAGQGDASPPARGAPSLVSVVMPMRNEARHVAEQLEALAGQTYAGPWEVVVVDDRCTDGSVEIVESWRASLPLLRVVKTSRRGLNHARNVGARAADGDLIAFCDADDVVVGGWLEALVQAAAGADLVGGPLDLEALNDEGVRAWRPADPPPGLPVAHGFLPYVPGGNCAIWAAVARRVGWDESYRFGSSDVEFSWRAQLVGYRLGYAPAAVCRQRYRATLGGTLRQHLRYGASVSHLYRGFRRHGLHPPGLTAAIRTWKGLLRNAPDLLRSSDRRGHWLRLAAVSAGRLGGSFRWRTLVP